MNVCTLATANHLAQVDVLAESVLEWEPSAEVTALVLDLEPPTSRNQAAWRAIGPHDLDLDPAEFRVMASIYDAYELSCALKPWLIRYVLEHGADAVLLLDADTLVLGPLGEVFERAREHSLVLTPHLIEPPAPMDEPSEEWILSAGTFNLGFMAVASGAEQFIAWWSARMRRDCLDDVRAGYVVDQRWVTLAPCYFQVDIVRDVAWNCAYWRVARSELIFDGKSLFVDGAPVKTFHFSGYDPDRPYLLTRHFSDRLPLRLSDCEDLRRLCDDYRARLLAAGHRQQRETPYRYGSFADGVPLDRIMRRAYREGVIRCEREDEAPPPGPFGADGGFAFLEWLGEAPDRRRSARIVSRYLSFLHESEEDISERFPDLIGDDAAPFVEWAQSEGIAERGLYPPLTRPAGAPWRRRQTPATRAGLNFVWPTDVGFGLIEAARLLRLGVAASSIDCADIVPDELTNGIYPANDWVVDRAVYDINLWAVNAAQLARFFHEVGTLIGHDRYTIAYWWWELGTFPPHRFGTASLAHEIWVGTDFVREAVEPAVDVPVVTIPIPVEASGPPAFSRAVFEIPETAYVFLFVFDFASSFARKNPLGLVDAYCRAFTPENGAVLVLKGASGDRFPESRERLMYAARARPDVIVIDESYSAQKVQSLMALCDAYVSLHHSEGFGLPLAEAMAAGKPVIATGYSGNLSFMNEKNSFLVDWSEGQVPEGSEPYPAGAFWADPDLAHAASLMRLVFDDRVEAGKRALRGRDEIREYLSAEVSGLAITERLLAIRALPDGFAARGGTESG